MLTGDKLETAENIGRSCNLITSKMSVSYLRSENLKDLQDQIQKLLSEKSSFEKKSIIIEG